MRGICHPVFTDYRSDHNSAKESTNVESSARFNHCSLTLERKMDKEDSDKGRGWKVTTPTKNTDALRSPKKEENTGREMDEDDSHKRHAWDGDERGDRAATQKKKTEEPLSPKKKAEKTSAAPKSPKKEKEKSSAAPKSPKKATEPVVRVQSDRAPYKLVKSVKDLGRDPLYAYLLPKLDAFKLTDVYKHRADNWGLIDVPANLNRWERPRRADYASITPEALYENFFVKRSDGARWFQYFLSEKFGDYRSCECTERFELMLKDTATYERCMYLLLENMTMLTRTALHAENPKLVKGLKDIVDEYWDSESRAPRQLTTKELKESEEKWAAAMAKKKEEEEKEIRKREMQKEKELEKQKKALEKEKEEMRLKNGGAPTKLVNKVMKLGRDPLYAYLLPKLDAFKSDEEYERRASDWGLIDVPDPGNHLDRWDRWDSWDYQVSSRGADYASITPEALFENFFVKRSDGGRWFKYFLCKKFYNGRDCECMEMFENMSKETTNYSRFKFLLSENLWMLRQTGLHQENPEVVDNLQKLYDKVKDMDLNKAMEKFQ